MTHNLELESCLSDQRYNFLKANHNPFTGYVHTVLLFIRSKIQFFESKSQRWSETWPVCRGCLSDQRYNFLKANHNCFHDCCFFLVLFIRSKIQFFESKSQQPEHIRRHIQGCLSDQRYNFLKANHNCNDDSLSSKKLFIRSKIQFFESKSQQYFCQNVFRVCCLSDQRYNFLKANHNTPQRTTAVTWLFIRSKIQFFESKSQQA